MSEKIKTTGAQFEYELEGAGGLRALHGFIRGVHVGDARLPDMDMWLLLGTREEVRLVLLWPTSKDWPIHALSCGDMAEGEGIEGAINAALKDYAGRHPDHPPCVPT